MATARRVLQQLAHDRRSVVLLIAVPALLLTLFRFVYDADRPLFDRVGPQFLGIFPFTTMFLVTSITMVRERTSGTLERLLTTPLERREFVAGYALAFGLVTVIALGPLGLNVRTAWVVVVFALADALLGSTMGLVMSTFATTEFQAVQFMPAVVFPQLLLCGLLQPRQTLVTPLRWASNVMPLSYATDAFTEATRVAGLNGAMARDLAVLVGCLVVFMALSAVSIRRTTA
jgi:ABC-2 type transport system permease protein